MIWLDDYDRKARLIPGLLVVLPVVLVIGSLGLREQPVVALIGGLLGTVGLPVLLASTVRSRGLKVQERLFSEWGVPPTTECLRHRGDVSSRKRREQWRSNVIKAVGHGLPSESDEESDPIEADDRYDAAVGQVRELTRDRKKFPLVFEENRNFGFERNLVGVRSAGIAVAALGCAVLVGSAVLPRFTDVEVSQLSIGIGLLACLCLLAVWIWVPTDERVRQIAFRYAERLLDSAGQVRPSGR